MYSSSLGNQQFQTPFVAASFASKCVAAALLVQLQGACWLLLHNTPTLLGLWRTLMLQPQGSTQPALFRVLTQVYRQA